MRSMRSEFRAGFLSRDTRLRADRRIRCHTARLKLAGNLSASKGILAEQPPRGFIERFRHFAAPCASPIQTMPPSVRSSTTLRRKYGP